MLRAGHPYYVMDLHTSIPTGKYTVDTDTELTRVKFGVPAPGSYLDEHGVDQRVEKLYNSFIHRGTFDEKNFKMDAVTASSLSWGCDTKDWITFMFTLITKKGDAKQPLSITDAGAGCGGDTLQFMLACWSERNTETNTRWPHVFSHVNSIELNIPRHEMLTHNINLLYQAYNNNPDEMDPTLPTILPAGAYQDYILEQGITQDVLYLDPPWAGKGEGDKRVGDLHMWHANNIDADGGNVKDMGFGVLDIVRATMAKNRELDDAGITQGITRIIVLKTPKIWNCEMRDTIRLEVKGCRVWAGNKNQFFIYFLRDERSQLPADEGYQEMTPDGPCQYYEESNTQQEFLRNNFGFDTSDFTAEKPMFLQDLWDMETFKEFEPGTVPPNTEPYLPGARENNTMHNGETKLLQSSLFTIM